MAVTDTFQDFERKLGEKLSKGKKAGMDEQALKQRATEIGDWLSNDYDPQSPEQRLLKELWEVADQSEKEALASVMVNLVSKKVGV